MTRDVDKSDRVEVVDRQAQVAPAHPRVRRGPVVRASGDRRRVERAVDVLERGDELLATRRVAMRVGRGRCAGPLRAATRSLNSFSRRAISRFRSAPRGSGVRADARLPAHDADERRCRPPASSAMIAAPRCGAAGPRQRQRQSAGRRRPRRLSPAMNVSPSAGISCWLDELRRRQLRVADLLHDDRQLLERAPGNGCADLERPARRPAARQADLHERLARRKRSLHLTCDARSRSPAATIPRMMPVPTAPVGMSNANGVGGFTGTRARVHDVEQVDRPRPLRRPARSTMRDSPPMHDLSR